MPKTLTLLIIWAAIIFCMSCAGCNGEPVKRQWESDGLRFEYVKASNTLRVSTMNDVPVVVPTTNIVFQKDASRLWTAEGIEVSLEGNEKRALWDFDEVVVLRPGVSLCFEIEPVAGATLTVDVPDAYTLDVHSYYKRLHMRIWQGKVELRP